jgi:hypothetical protein
VCFGIHSSPFASLCLMSDSDSDVLLRLSGWYVHSWTYFAAFSCREGHCHLFLLVGMHLTGLFCSKELWHSHFAEISPGVRNFIRKPRLDTNWKCVSIFESSLVPGLLLM